MVVASLSLAPSPVAAAPFEPPRTFALGPGVLAITTPVNGSLSTATAALGGTSVTGQLGTTTVSDARFTLVVGGWTVSASCTDFVSGQGAVIPKANAAVYSGAATATSGIVIFVPTTALTPRSMAGSGGAIASATGVLLSTSVSYRPTMTVTIPATARAGTYSATFTQTAS